VRALVVELGVEEIPSEYLPGLIADLRQLTLRALAEERLDAIDLEADGTPRRLVVWGRIPDQQAPRRQEVLGPPVAVAYGTDGAPTPAAEGFARRVGVAVAELVTVDGRVAARVDAPVADAATVVTARMSRILGEQLAAPRAMRWSSDDVKFVRPVRWILALLDAEVLPIAALGQKAGRTTYGNRTDHPEAMVVASAAAYPGVLAAAGVELVSGQRRRLVADGAAKLAAAAGGSARWPAVEGEVADLVEWPAVFRGQFDPAYLRVPEEILTTAMVHHQRYLPVTDASGHLLPYFIGVANGHRDDMSDVIHGNERVLRARLADAAFFYDEDQRTSTAARQAQLAGMMYRDQMGTYQDKTARLVELAERWGARLGLTSEEQAALVRAAALAKLDLVTHVVGEFPELEGVMGGVYARQAGEPASVAEAVGSQYQPRTAADPLPPSRVARALSLLDRLDELASGTAAGLAVSGSQDPFGLRRSALALGRLLVDGGFGHEAGGEVNQDELLRAGLAACGVESPDAAAALHQLVAGRLRTWLEGAAPADVVEAVLAAPAPWTSIRPRLAMLAALRVDDTWTAVAQTAKRISRLVGDTPPAAGQMHPEPEASALAAALADSVRGGRDWSRWPEYAARLAERVARFFDALMVMDPDPAVRGRRLALLAAVRAFLCDPVDWSRISTEVGDTVS